MKTLWHPIHANRTEHHKLPSLQHSRENIIDAIDRQVLTLGWRSLKLIIDMPEWISITRCAYFIFGWNVRSCRTYLVPEHAPRRANAYAYIHWEYECVGCCCVECFMTPVACAVTTSRQIQQQKQCFIAWYRQNILWKKLFGSNELCLSAWNRFADRTQTTPCICPNLQPSRTLRHKHCIFFVSDLRILSA